MDNTAIVSAISGCDAVVSALGAPLKFTYASVDSLKGHPKILRARQENPVRSGSSAGQLQAPSSQATSVRSSPPSPAHLRGSYFRRQNRSRRSLQRARAKPPPLDRRPLCGPDGSPYTGKVMVGLGGTKMGFSVSRADIAAFMTKTTQTGSVPRPSKFAAVGWCVAARWIVKVLCAASSPVHEVCLQAQRGIGDVGVESGRGMRELCSRRDAKGNLPTEHGTSIDLASV